MGSLIESQGDSPNVENKCLVLADECNSSNSGAQRKRPKTGSGRSNVWDYFVKIGVGGDGKQKCKCKSCGKVYTCGYVGTSHLHYHITKCPVITKSRIQNAAEKLEVRRLDQRIVRELTTRMVIQHELPFQFVELEGFRAFTKYVSSDQAQFVSRDAVTDDVLKVYSLEKDKLKQQLAAISGRVCLTFRCWTSSCSSQGYVALTAQYMDEDWKLNVKLLNFCHLDPPHDNFELSRKVLDCLKEWEIERKIFSITVDNASTNEDLKNLKQLLCLHNSLLSNGDYFHYKCCARVLNLMVEESLVVVSDVVHKIRESVEYVGASSSRLKQFYQCVEEVGGFRSVDALYLDVSGKWNSIYMMLKSAIYYRRAFVRMRSKDMEYRHCPSSEEWDRGEKICRFLKIFYGLTNMVSESTYPTPITHSLDIWEIEYSLTNMKLSTDHKIRDMASKMLDEFDKYLSEYSMILAFGVVLSPNMKLDHLEFAYFRLVDDDINVARDKVSNVRKALSALFNEYANKGATTSSSLSAIDTCFSPSTLEEKPKLSPLAEYREYREQERQKKYDAGMTQLDLYLEEPTQEYADTLDYWKNNSRIYGDLARMAKDVLSVPMITVASESIFSIGGFILDKYKSCMLSENLQALIYSHNWLFGFSPSDGFGDVIEETRKIDINLSKQDSNALVFDEDEDED